MMNSLKKLTLFRQLILVIQLKKLTITKKFLKLKRKNLIINNYGKYITTQEFNMLTADDFAARLAQEKLATKANIADFIKVIDFTNKLKNINKKSYFK